LLAVARRFLRNEEDAADAVQETFLSAFRSLDRFQENSALGTWLHRIVVNTCLMKLRSQARRPMRSLDVLLPKFDSTGHHANPMFRWSETSFERMASEEAKVKVRACIDQLPEDYRTVLILRDIEEFDTDQTAGILGLNPGAVKTRLHRARQALRSLLEPYMNGGFSPH
jgi:RNA polymerase sigma-70 factor (ECF subfamily)